MNHSLSAHVAVLAVMFFTMWVMLVGISVMLQRHRQFIRWSGRVITFPARYLWHRYRTIIIALAIGIMAGMVLLSLIQQATAPVLSEGGFYLLNVIFNN